VLTRKKQRAKREGRENATKENRSSFKNAKKRMREERERTFQGADDIKGVGSMAAEVRRKKAPHKHQKKEDLGGLTKN